MRVGYIISFLDLGFGYGHRTKSGSADVTKILYIEHNMDGSIGGSHYALLDIVRGMDRTRYRPVVLFFEGHSLLQAFSDTGAEVLVGRPGRGPVALKFTSLLPKVLRRTLQAGWNGIRLLTTQPLAWIRLLRSVRPDLIHFNNSFNGDHDLIVAAKVLGIPCIAHQRGVPGVTGPVEVMFSRGFSAIIAISTTIRDDVLARGVDPRRVRLIHDGLDPERVVVRRPGAELLRSLGLRPTDRIIGMVGNVKPWKGQHVLIGALAHLRAEHPDLHCIFVGAIVDQGYFRRLEDLLGAAGVRDRAHFVGFDSNPADFVTMMEVVVHASVEPEPFGLVVVEAMALSKPVVATTIGGPRDVVEDGVTGYLCPPEDDVALAGCLARLLANPACARQMGTAGRERLLAAFTSAAQVQTIQHLYDELLHR